MRAVSGWESFEPWLSRIEKLDEDAIWRVAGEIPPAWYGASWDELEGLVRRLIERKTLVRELILAFRSRRGGRFRNGERMPKLAKPSEFGR